MVENTARVQYPELDANQIRGSDVTAVYLDDFISIWQIRYILFYNLRSIYVYIFLYIKGNLHYDNLEYSQDVFEVSDYNNIADSFIVMSLSVLFLKRQHYL